MGDWWSHFPTSPATTCKEIRYEKLVKRHLFKVPRLCSDLIQHTLKLGLCCKVNKMRTNTPSLDFEMRAAKHPH